METNMAIQCFLSILFAMTGQSGPQVLPPYHHGFPLTGVNFTANSEALDVLSIVRCDGKRQSLTRNGQYRPSGPVVLFPVHVEDVTVVDSPTMSAGTHLRLVIDATPYIHDFTQQPLVAGARYLVFGLTARQGHLIFPVESRTLSTLNLLPYAEADEPNEVAVANMFMTQSEKLPTGKEGGDLQLAALLDTFAQSGGANSCRIAKFLDKSTFPGWPEQMFYPNVFPDSEASNQLRSIAAAATDPVLKARAYEVLVHKQVLRADGLYVQALMDVIGTPSSYLDPYSSPGTDIYDTNIEYVPEEFQHRAASNDFYAIQFDQSRCNELGATAPPSIIRYYLTDKLVKNLTANQIQSYVQLLGKSSVRDENLLLRKLPEWTNSPEKKPKYDFKVSDSNGPKIRDRAELIAYWKARYLNAVNP